MSWGPSNWRCVGFNQQGRVSWNVLPRSFNKLCSRLLLEWSLKYSGKLLGQHYRMEFERILYSFYSARLMWRLRLFASLISTPDFSVVRWKKISRMFAKAEYMTWGEVPKLPLIENNHFTNTSGAIIGRSYWLCRPFLLANPNPFIHHRKLSNGRILPFILIQSKFSAHMILHTGSLNGFSYEPGMWNIESFGLGLCSVCSIHG